MQTIFSILIWLLFWPLILLFRLIFWLSEVVGVPWAVLGFLYGIIVMGFFGLLLRLDRRDSGAKMSRSLESSWIAVTSTTAAAVVVLVLLCEYFSYQMTGASQICGMFALMLPILVGCLWFLIGLLGEKNECRMTAVCCTAAVLIPVIFGGGFHLSGMAELKSLRETAVVCEGTVTDCAMSERGAYIGVKFDDGGGQCFYEVYGAPFPDGISIGDRVKITAAGDKAAAVETTE